MAQQEFSDESLMAYADGELDAETARRVETALRTDPDLADRLAIFTGTRDILARAASERPLDPVPEALMERLRATLDSAKDPSATATVTDLTKVRASRGGWHPAALAASLALAVGLAGGYYAARIAAPDAAALQVALLRAEGLEPALSQLLSGEERQLPAGLLRVIVSFRDDRDALCREYELDVTGGKTLLAVTCREGVAWETRLAIAAEAGDDTGYAPAASLDTLEGYLMAIGAGPALGLEEEAELLRPQVD